MTDDVERVARALCELNFQQKGCEGGFGDVDDCWFAFEEQARAAIAALTASSGWRTIESAPEWQSVLVFQREAYPTKSNRTGVFTAVRTEKGWALSCHGRRKGEFLVPPPTHWQPLPTPPGDEDRMREALRRARRVIATRLFDPDELAAIDAALGSGGEG